MKSSVFVLLCVGMLMHMLHASTAPVSFKPRVNQLGSSSNYGYAKMKRYLADLELGADYHLPIYLIFSSDPAVEPGAFGPYWHIPLFSSKVVKSSQYNMYWDRPDERRSFFSLQRNAKVKNGEKLYQDRGQEWEVHVDERRSEVRINSIKDSEWYYVYKNSVLVGFKLGGDSDEFKITYSGRGLPLYVTNLKSNRRIFEIVYRGAVDPERIVIGDKIILVEMGDGDVTAPDGKTNYRNYRVKFLSKLRHSEDQFETFEYSKADRITRKVKMPAAVASKAKAALKQLDLAVNEITSVRSYEGAEALLTWEAKSGFITADSEASYIVKSDSWDPNIPIEKERPLTPSAVNLTRKPVSGADAERWSYNWNSGVMEFTDRKTGELVRRTFIMSAGPALSKLRREERMTSEGSWEVTDLRSYNPGGQLLRQKKDELLRVYDWDGYPVTGPTVTETIGGKVMKTFSYEGSQLLERVSYESNGVILKQIFGRNSRLEELKQSYPTAAVLVYKKEPNGILKETLYNGDHKVLFALIDEELFTRNQYDDQGRLLYRERGDGRDESYFYNPDGSYVKSVLRPEFNTGELISSDTYFYAASGELNRFVNAFSQTKTENTNEKN